MKASIVPIFALSMVVTGCPGRGVLHENRDFVLAEGFLGPVVLLYDDPKGRELLRQPDGRVTVTVPADGIVRLRMKAPRGVVGEMRYFVVERTAQHQLRDDRDVPPGEVCVFMKTMGVVPGPPERLPDGTTQQSTESRGSRVYESFIVGIPTSRNDWYDLRSKHVDRAISER